MGLRIVSAELDDFRARVVIPLPPRPSGPADRWRPAVDIAVPVHNREAELATRIRHLHAFLATEFPFSVRITIADDASTDGTRAVAERLAHELSGVHVLRINDRGRGRALAAAWLTSEAKVVAYLDVDRGCDFSTLLAQVARVISGRSDVSVGGLKVIRADAARRLIPDVGARGERFDAELLARAGRAGLRIHIA